MKESLWFVHYASLSIEKNLLTGNKIRRDKTTHEIKFRPISSNSSMQVMTLRSSRCPNILLRFSILIPFKKYFQNKLQNIYIQTIFKKTADLRTITG